MASSLSDVASGTYNWSALRAKYVDAAMADRAGGSLATGVKHFLRFCIYGRHVSPIRWTERSSHLAAKVADEALLMDFAIWLVLAKPTGRSISIDTAIKYISSVKAWHERKFYRAIGADLEMKRLKDLFKGMRRHIGQAPKAVRYGVRTQHLAQALHAYHSVDVLRPSKLRSDELDSLNWVAALSAAFCGLMRGGEIAVEDGSAWSAVFNLSRADVKFGSDEIGDFVVIMMRPLKNGRHLRGKNVPIVLRPGKLLNPVAALRRLVDFDPVPPELEASTPLFRLRRLGGVVAARVSDVRKEVKRLMQLLGLQAEHFGAHSLRIGGASAAAAAGVPPAVIRCCGRWNSDIFEIYTRISKEAAGRMTSLIGSTAFHDLERGFQTEELELLPEEMSVEPEFDDFEFEGIDEWVA